MLGRSIGSAFAHERQAGIDDVVGLAAVESIDVALGEVAASCNTEMIEDLRE
jgi:hypothetical protein